MKKQYKGDTADYERKLASVMKRMGVENYNCDWNQSKGGASCYVKMLYEGRVYQFENSVKKSKAAGRNLFYVSDLLASVVLALECIARAAEQDIFTLDMLLTGALGLPEASILPDCFVAMGFERMPESREDLEKQYKKVVKTAHPDTGGSTDEFLRIQEAYDLCVQAMEG